MACKAIVGPRLWVGTERWDVGAGSRGRTGGRGGPWRESGHACGWRRNVGTCVRDKGGDLSAEVTPGRSQSLHSTEAPPMREVKAVPSETRHRRAGEQTLPVASRGERKVRRPQPGLREGRQEGGCEKDR